jgi:hypothetical protein
MSASSGEGLPKESSRPNALKAVRLWGARLGSPLALMHPFAGAPGPHAEPIDANGAADEWVPPSWVDSEQMYFPF